MDRVRTTPGFCSDCGSILPLLKSTGDVVCYTCKKTCQAEGIPIPIYKFIICSCWDRRFQMSQHFSTNFNFDCSPFQILVPKKSSTQSISTSTNGKIKRKNQQRTQINQKSSENVQNAVKIKCRTLHCSYVQPMRDKRFSIHAPNASKFQCQYSKHQQNSKHFFF